MRAVRVKGGNSTSFKKGEPGNCRGRPKGSRNRLSELFFHDVLADWEKHGAAAIAKLRTERPHDYVKVIAGLVPRDFNVRVNELDELTDEQVGEQLAAAIARLKIGDGDDEPPTVQ